MKNLLPKPRISSLHHNLIPRSRYSTMTSTNRKAINLLRGWPAPSLHPTKQLAEAAQTVFQDDSIRIPALQYGPDDGYLPLRTAISKWLAPFYACPDDVSRICITGGASQNMACVLQVFTDPVYTRACWMVAPCYFLGCKIFQDNGFAGKLRAVREDEEGIDLEMLEREMERLDGEEEGDVSYKQPQPYSKFYRHVIYVVSTFSNPSGRTMSLDRRTQLVNLARKHDALIISDDVYDMLQWPTDNSPIPSTPTAVLPRLSDIDRTLQPLSSDPKKFGNTISNSSFSKITGPGMRTGWTDSSPALCYALSQCGSSRSGGCPSQLSAAIICQLLESGALPRHIQETLLPSYQKRWELLMTTIEKELVPLGVQVSRSSLAGRHVAGGYFVWIHLPEGLQAEEVAQLAWSEEELVLGRGSLFEVAGDEKAARFERELRMCLSWVDHEDLVEGVRRLGRVVKLARENSRNGGVAAEGPSLKKSLGEFK